MRAWAKSRENNLYLMVQTPKIVFVYWKLYPDYIEMAKSQIQDTSDSLVLRLFRHLTGRPPEEVARLNISDGSLTGSTYFYGLMPYTTYFTEISLAYQGGNFTLIRSKHVIAPPAEKIAGDYVVTHAFPDTVPPMVPFTYSPEEIKQKRDV
ncbi:MAG: DUF4912 domain-containing protein [Clostridiales bacterium]|jgi:hypothetical protein|nr:DUF4912 domain-containing protein [Clostridiales bacterium]